MNCDQWFEKLYLYIDKDLDAISWNDVDAHMKQCRPCCNRYDLEVKLRTRLQKSCKFEVCTEALRVRIQTILKKL